MSTHKQVPGLGIARLDGGGLAYRLADPLTIDEVGGLARQSWCHRLVVTDASADGRRPAEIRAICELDGEPFVLVGQIGEGA
ncbi:hypothetical protein [Streptomyces sp. CB01881]|uniref:hypothetical protein n=1 Tax=Streptomyces sp. CB01881 TaxID=2078691 RepID=UPI000CDBBA1F|nr:hypothetical protein [Streptomyces sp. CB01881]AUY51265.1 hypothetical protein C2142_22605 [Streptomyces sp. CB01881]TYC74651.1 hypothetical protein EH183_22580 [Streptomyces sp. CB01881]